MNRFLRTLDEQRWDDHRYYHHSRVNQSLHLLSAISFLCSYVLLFTSPVAAALMGWLFAMVIAPGRALLLRAQGLRRGQPGHARVQGSGQGRLQPAPEDRAAVDLGAVAACPVGRSFARRACSIRSAASCGNLSLAWIVLGFGAVLFRTVQLFFLQDVTERPRVDDQDPHRPVPRHQAVPPGAAPRPARRAVRPDRAPPGGLTSVTTVGERSPRGGRCA